MDKSELLRLIRRDVNEMWDDYTRPLRYQYIAQRFSKRAQGMGLDLRDLVRGDEEISVFRTSRGGYVLFPKYAYEELKADWENVSKSFDLLMP